MQGKKLLIRDLTEWSWIGVTTSDENFNFKCKHHDQFPENMRAELSKLVMIPMFMREVMEDILKVCIYHN